MPPELNGTVFELLIITHDKPVCVWKKAYEARMILKERGFH